MRIQMIILNPGIRGAMSIGVDEAGRGPVMGPMIVCALHHGDISSLVRMGVKDSKLLSPVKREEIYAVLSRTSSHSLLIIPAHCIDSSRERMTLNRLEVLSFSSVLASLLSGEELIHPELPGDVRMVLNRLPGEDVKGPIIMDAADVNEKRFGEDVAAALGSLADASGIPVRAMHRADMEYPVVGAASILAKVNRDRLIEEISAELGVPVGSGYPGDRNTRAFLERWVRENGDLPPHCRRSWETARKLLGDRDQTSLLSFGDG